MRSLRKLRIILAFLLFSSMCLIFLDSSGIVSNHLAFLAKIQFLPALLLGSVITISALLISAFLFGRIYCSVVCPLGIFQDIIGFFGKKRKFWYRRGNFFLRALILAVFTAALFGGFPLVWNIIEPYSVFGRITAGLFSPIWALCHNFLAKLSEISNIFWISDSPIWIRGHYAFGSALLTFTVLVFLVLKSGRIWCNSICPVGTVLGAVSRFAIFFIKINSKKCQKCSLCENSCKCSCIDSKTAIIDKSRCVVCLNCLEACQNNAISYSRRKAVQSLNISPSSVNVTSRRAFLLSSGAILGIFWHPITLRASDFRGDLIPALTRQQRRKTPSPIIPPGASGLNNFTSKCNGCQLCVTNCPNEVLISFDKSLGALQPTLSFTHGYCRTTCVKCSTICPTGAIQSITIPEKSAIQIGRAQIDRSQCIRTKDDVNCSACARNCPAGVINLIQTHGGSKNLSVDEERCTGCGACEYFCPVRPRSAIMVIGNVEHHKI